MIPQHLLQSLLSFSEFLLARMSHVFAANDREHLQANHDYGTECHRVEGHRVVIRAVVGHPHHATRANLRLQARGALWL